MGFEGSRKRVFQQRGGGSSGLNSDSESMFYGSNWDLGNSNMASQSEFVNPLLADLLPRIPAFGSCTFSEMVTSVSHNTHLNLPPKKGVSQDHSPNWDNGIMSGASSYGKRREVAEGASSPNKAEEEEDDEKKQKLEKKGPGSNGAEDSYIHVRAKRGQATNSHSLAERVRRERISERMRLLQELVPGCNEITGKAMMLDEIINYVQSLQQQVEFLSMKLATVNPDLNMDIDRILSKDVRNPHLLTTFFN